MFNFLFSSFAHRIYAFEPELARLYPGNRHIQPKIRQQLQVLRDRGLLKQPQRGVPVSHSFSDG